MRTKTLASLIILCGSTAALAQMTTSPSAPTQANTQINGVTGDDALTNTPDTPADNVVVNSGDDQPPQ